MNFLSHLQDNSKEALKISTGGLAASGIANASAKNPIKDNLGFEEKDTFVVKKEGKPPTGAIKKEVKTSSEAPGVRRMGVNLIPEDFIEVAGWEKRRVKKTAGLVLFLSLVLLLGGYLVLDYFDKKVSRKLKMTNYLLEEARSKIALYQKIETHGLQLYSKIQLAKLVLDNHIYWTNVLKFLEEKTIPSVYYKNITNNIANGVTISAFATDFESVARQILALQKEDIVREVKVSSISTDKIDEKELLDPSFPRVVIKFEMALNFNPVIFSQNWQKN